MAPKKNIQHKQALSQQPSPDWPPFKPLLSPSDLSLENVLSSQIVVVRNFWTGTLCKNYVNFLKTLPLTTTGKPKRGEAVRVNDRFQILDHNFARRLWLETSLKQLICGPDVDVDGAENQLSKSERRNLWGGEVVGLNPSIRIYRYSKGQFFDKHYDDYNFTSLEINGITTPAVTTWTLLLYLTSPATGCVGGETVFYPEKDLKKAERNLGLDEVVISLETGMLLLHKHGKDCLLHEGKEVLNGEKWVIRTDICVRR